MRRGTAHAFDEVDPPGIFRIANAWSVIPVRTAVNAMGAQLRAQSIACRSDEVTASGHSGSTTAGKLAAEGWLRARLVSPPALTPWHVEISLGVLHGTPTAAFDERTDTRLRIEIYSDEWGIFFCHQGKTSWIRVTDIAFVHGRDDFSLLAQLPPLKDLGSLVRSLERQHALAFRREHALVRTNVPGAEAAVRSWLRSL